jgi:S1-C subfamily serine protease
MVWSYVSTSNQPPASDRSTKVDPPAAPPPKSEQLSGPASIFEASKRSVVRIYIPNGGYGSGFIVTPEGHLLTADYVLRGEGPWRIATWDGTEHQAELVGVHAESKLAIARLRGAVTHPPLTFRSQKAVPDENVLVVGSTATDIVTYEQGVVRAEEAEMVAAVFARFATGGLGGGPVIDERGKAIGLYYQRKQQPGASGESVRLFLPASTAVAVLRRFGIWTKPI